MSEATFVFADIAGFTAFTEAHSDDSLACAGKFAQRRERFAS